MSCTSDSEGMKLVPKTESKGLLAAIEFVYRFKSKDVASVEDVISDNNFVHDHVAPIVSL